MEKIEIKDFQESVLRLIGEEWMLVAAADGEGCNMMTASWGGLGWLWNKPVAFVFIRPERYTYGLIEQNEMLTLSFLGNSAEARDIYKLCGSKSGRDMNKTAATGLTPVVLENNGVGFAQSRLTLECRRLFASDFAPEQFLDKSLLERWYGSHGGYHRMYIVEIVQAYKG